MAYTVRTEIFEGPFDLLLHLVAKQRLDITAISISDIADQYLAFVDRMQDLDLDVASDFLLVAATLLEIKAARLLPEETSPVIDEEWEDLTPEEARDLLVARLLAYKQFKNAAAEIGARMESEARMHPREAGLEAPFLKLMPDFLEGVTLRSLAVICADLLHRREVFLLQAEHVAAMPISLELHMEVVSRMLMQRKRTTFLELVGGGASPEEFVVTLLAILELYKQGFADIRQESQFGDIDVVLLDEEVA
ncbi:MAG: segregation/condensation protein A [Coriobacteriaceae bacterium]|nr:segregation/condensation protein A [Coriobacteriaceae bacterium]